MEILVNVIVAWSNLLKVVLLPVSSSVYSFEFCDEATVFAHEISQDSRVLFTKMNNLLFLSAGITSNIVLKGSNSANKKTVTFLGASLSM